MVDFTEIVRWDTPAVLRDNRTYGLERPAFESITVEEKGLSVSFDSVFGRAVYKYDFGRDGLVKALRFTGTDFLKFRIKTADSAGALGSVEYDGTETDVFAGTVIDTVKYTVDPQAYTVVQSGGISMSGTQTMSGVFVSPAKMMLNTSLSDTYSVRASMRLLIGDPIYDSGAFSFLELDTGTDNIQVQKYHAQIRSQIVDAYGNSLGRDVDSNNIVLGEQVDVKVNNILVDTASALTDGTFGVIQDQVTNPIVTDEFQGLKAIEEVTNFFGRTTLEEDYVRVLGLRADYSTTGILADLQRGLFYRPKRVHGYYTMRVPLVNPHIDLFANRITSFNLVGGQYRYAEVNDVWTTTILVPAGIHYYRFIADGEAQLDITNPNAVEIAAGTFSLLTLESTQFVEFVFRGAAESVYVVGSFDGFSETNNPMTVGFDPSEILKVSQEGETYFNDHKDWHKIEVEFEHPVPIIGIRFLTEVPFEHKQRVKILLDGVPITKDEWEIQCSPEEVAEPGVSECATYSNLLAGTFVGDCQSYFINNTDTIAASEDGWVEWHFVTDEPINKRTPKRVRKFAFLTRLENGAIYHRSHRGLELLVPEDFVARVTDYLISDNEVEFRSTRRTQVCLRETWEIPQVVLQSGVNILTPVQISTEGVTYGEPISITHNDTLSFIEHLDQSGISLNNVEIAYTLADNLTQDLTTVIEVVDVGGSTSGGGGGPDDRFTRESFTRANDQLRVVVISIRVEPVRVYYLHLVGQLGNFALELYETEEDANTRTNRIGYAESSGYGFQVLPVFVAERQIETAAGLEDVVVSNVIVCFDEHAADTVFINRPRANI